MSPKTPLKQGGDIERSEDPCFDSQWTKAMDLQGVKKKKKKQKKKKRREAVRGEKSFMRGEIIVRER